MARIRPGGLTAAGVVQCQFQAFPATGGKPLRGKSSRSPQANEPDQSASQRLGGKAGGQEGLGSRPPAFPGDPQKKVFGAYIAVAQFGGALLSQAQGGLRPNGKFNGAYDCVSSPLYQLRTVRER